MAFYRGTTGTYTSNIDLTRQTSPLQAPLVPSTSVVGASPARTDIAQISAVEVAVQQTGAVQIVPETSYKVEGTSETFGIVGEIVQASRDAAQESGEVPRETTSIFSEDTNIAYLPVQDRIEQLTGIDVNAQMINIPEGKFNVSDAVRDLLDKSFSPFQSALMDARRQQEAIENALKGTLFIALKSDFSGELEANTLQVPAINGEFVYNFYEETEDDTIVQEDTSKDPLFSSPLEKVPRYARITWESVNIVNPLEIQNSVTVDEQKVVDELITQPKDSSEEQSVKNAFDLASNAKIFGSSVSVSLQNQNTPTTSFASNIFGRLFRF